MVSNDDDKRQYKLKDSKTIEEREEGNANLRNSKENETQQELPFWQTKNIGKKVQSHKEQEVDWKPTALECEI